MPETGTRRATPSMRPNRRTSMQATRGRTDSTLSPSSRRTSTTPKPRPRPQKTRQRPKQRLPKRKPRLRLQPKPRPTRKLPPRTRATSSGSRPRKPSTTKTQPKPATSSSRRRTHSWKLGTRAVPGWRLWSSCCRNSRNWRTSWRERRRRRRRLSARPQRDGDLSTSSGLVQSAESQPARTRRGICLATWPSLKTGTRCTSSAVQRTRPRSLVCALTATNLSWRCRASTPGNTPTLGRTRSTRNARMLISQELRPSARTVTP
mmetsp:Transcript_30123/g.65050  ORF Transcript_30123/g.65050 Transcript_30123/m.65050 type:complete len:262 (+) Transcript_30123:203-988(+)